MRLPRHGRGLIGVAILALLALALVLVVLGLERAPAPIMEEEAKGGGPLEEEVAPIAPEVANEPAPTPKPGPTPTAISPRRAPPTPDPTRAGQLDPQRFQLYVVRQGDTLGAIASAFGCTVEEIVANNQVDPQRIWPGQRLTIPAGVGRIGPDLKLLPDSELVYGPAYRHFNLTEFVAAQGGYLAGYREEVEGRTRSGVEVVQLVAQRYSLGPRALLALLELKSGWVANPSPPAESLSYPMGSVKDSRRGLFQQLSWAAMELNSGYYGWKYGDWSTLRLADGTRVGIAPGLNAGTVAVQNWLAQVASGAEWERLAGPEGFPAAYERLFGDPFARAVEPLVPANLVQPELRLPWEAGEMWYLTGGPHSGWGRGSAWAALDFVPPGAPGYQPSSRWAIAVAGGLVIRSDNGEVVVDLDGDGFEGTGWALTYMHIYHKDRVAAGTWLKRGERIGHPSCEGGVADSTHLHLARRYNGEWILAGRGPAPMVLSGWTAQEAASEYDGRLTKGELVREACQCTKDEVNGLLSNNVVLD